GWISIVVYHHVRLLLVQRRILDRKCRRVSLQTDDRERIFGKRSDVVPLVFNRTVAAVENCPEHGLIASKLEDGEHTDRIPFHDELACVAAVAIEDAAAPSG